MAEKAPRTLWFWQACALAGIVASGLSGARVTRSAHAARAAPSASISAKAAATPHIEVEVSLAEPPEDALLARLRVAETAGEECELLERLSPAEDPAKAYAITEVLERTRLRSVRACAASALTQQPNPPAQSWLIDLAADADPDVRHNALEALAAHGDSAARAVVIELAHSDDSDVRASAVSALLRARYAEAFPAALELLDGVDQRETLGALVEALGASQDPRALPVLSRLVLYADSETELLAISALGELGQKQAQALLGSLLEVGSDDEYQAAAKALAKLAPESTLARLQAAVRSTNDDRRRTGFAALIDSGLPGVTPILLDALRGSDIGLASDVLHHLARQPDAAFEPEITAMLDRDDSQLRRLALHALARLGTPSALGTLRKLAETDALGSLAQSELERAPGAPDYVRAMRIAELERGSPRALRALTTDPSEAAQNAVLAHFSGDNLDSEQFAAAIAVAPAGTVARLAAGTSSADGAQRQALIDGLVQRGDPRFLDLLRPAALDENDEIRRSALRGLVRLDDAESTRWLTTAANAADPSERAFAAELLGERTDASALALLETLAADPDTNVASTAIGQIQTRSPELAVTLTKRAFDAAEPQDRPALLSSLASQRSGLSLALCDRALRDADENVVLECVQALADVQGPDNAQRLIGVASDERHSPEVRASAAQALRGLGGPLVRANRALLDALAPPDAAEPFTCSAR